MTRARASVCRPLVAAALAALVASGVGTAGIPEAPSGASASLDSVVTNELTVRVHSDGAAAVANCQLLVVVDVVVLNLAAADGLSLIDEDEVQPEAAAEEGHRSRAAAEDDARATCAQRVGDIRIRAGALDGWGEEAPEAAWGVGGSAGGPGTAWGAFVLGARAPSSVASNDLRVHTSGAGGVAVASCQLLVGVNVFIVNAAHTGMAASPPSLVDATSRTSEEGGADAGDASCDVSVELVEIILADA